MINSIKNFIKQRKVLAIVIGSIILLIIAGTLLYFFYFKDSIENYFNTPPKIVYEGVEEEINKVKTLAPGTSVPGTVKEKNGNQIKIEIQVNDPSKSVEVTETSTILTASIIDYTISPDDSIIISESIKTGPNLYKIKNSEGSINDITVGSSITIKSFEQGKIIYITK